MDCIMENQTPISTEEPSSSAKVRNWAELPLDVLYHIFLKLGAIDILFRAQSVCSMWRKVSKEPLMFRSIDMRNRFDGKFLFGYFTYTVGLYCVHCLTCFIFYHIML
ncbi:hypothetical protein MKX01_037146 [Papaver californicum]|nr:hypothetical protein MKX01_037146 [Papaver californicum]